MIMARSSGCAKTVAFFLVSLVFCVNMFQQRLLKPGIPLLPSSGTLGPRSMQTWGMTLSSATTFFGFQIFRMAACGWSALTAISRAPFRTRVTAKAAWLTFTRIASPSMHRCLTVSCRGTVVRVSFWWPSRSRTMIALLHRLSTTCKGWGSSSQLGGLQLVTVFVWVPVNGCLNLRVVIVPVLLALLLS